MTDGTDGGRTAQAPHRPESVPRTCWTCSRHTCVFSGMTECPHIDTYNHTKMGVEPCEKYDLNAVWLMVDWFYPSAKHGKNAKRMGR